MPAKSSRNDGNILQWFLDRSEETLNRAMRDLTHGGGLPDGLAKVFGEAGKTKGRMDQNVEMLLHFLNLPSRADYNKLVGKLEHLQGSLVNLNMKLDRLLAAQRQPPRSPRRKSKVGRPGHS